MNGIVIVDKPSAILASGIVVITAMTTEDNIVISLVITVPNSFTAAIAGAGV